MKTGRPETYVIPDESTPRVYGVVAIVIASALLVSNLGMLGMYAATPVLKPMSLRAEAWMNRVFEAQVAKTLARLKRDEAAAKTPQEKATAATTVATFERRLKPRINTMSMSWAASEPPMVRAYGVAEALVSLLLDAAMLVAGVGLVGLRAWALRAMLWVASIKLARIALFVVVMMGWIMPTQIRVMKARMAESFAAGQPGGTVPTITPEIMAAMVTGSVMFYGLLAAIVPILLLVKLRTPRVKAACRTAELSSGGFGP